MISKTIRLGLVGAVLAMAPCAMPAADGGAAGGAIRHVAPYLDDQTCFVAAITLPDTVGDDYLSKLGEWLGQVHPDAKEGLNEVRRAAAALVRAGARELYMVGSLADMPDRSPLLVIPTADDSSAEAVLQLLRGDGVVAEHWERVIISGDQETIDRAKRARPVERPEIAAALSAVEASAMSVCFTPSEDQRQVFSCMLPRLPMELGGGSIRVLAAGCRWAALSLDPESLTIRLSIQSADDRAANALRDLWSDVMLRACRHPDVIAAMPRGGSSHELLTPRLEGDRLILDINGHDGGPAVLAAALRFPLALSRDAAHRGVSRQNLLTLGLAFQTLSDRAGGFPPTAICSEDGKPLLSWRVGLLPMLGEDELFQQFHLDEPWDSEHNSSLIKQMPAVYRRPSVDPARVGQTPYLAVIGDGTALSATAPTGDREFLDFTSTTIMLVEADAEHEVVWTKPSDLEYDASQPLRGLVDTRLGGFSVLFADGKARFLPNNIDLGTLRAMFTRAGGETVDLEE